MQPSASEVRALDDLTTRLDLLVAQRLLDTGLVALDTRRGEIAEDLADDVVITGFLEVGANDVLGVGFGLDVAQPHLPGGPFAEQSVAPSRDAEAHLLVVRELGLERFLAVVES